jgi:hypothetical protein
MVGQTNPNARGTMAPEEALRDILTLQEQKFILERKIKQERAIAEAVAVLSSVAVPTETVLLEDQLRLSVEQQVRSFRQPVSLANSAQQREDLKQQAQRLELQLLEERTQLAQSLNNTVCIASSTIGDLATATPPLASSGGK